MATDAGAKREFLQQLGDLVAGLRAEINAHQLGLDPSPLARAYRRERVLYHGDFEFFCYTYFPHHIRRPASLFHEHFFERFPRVLDAPGGVREWWVAPRGEAKSSLLTKIGPAWLVVQALLQREECRQAIGWTGAPPEFLDYALMLGAETSLPTKLVEVVKTELTSNATLQLDFPEVCGRTGLWRVGEFVSASGVKLEAFGGEQAVRGTFFGASRPKVLLGDDLITDKEAKSPTERDNRWNWIEKAIDYLGPPDGSVKFLAVGTVLDRDDPISRAKGTVGHVVHHFRAIERMPDQIELWHTCEELMRNADRVVAEEAAAQGKVCAEEALPSFKFYLENKAEMDAGAVISWPEVRSLYWLMRQRVKSPRAFSTEMQGEPRSEADRVFTPVHFFVSRLPHWLIFGACDPSLGKDRNADPSAILVGGYDRRSQKLHVLYAEIKRRLPSKLEADLIAAQREFNCIAFAFENNGAFEHSRQTFMSAALAKGVRLPLVGVTAEVAPEVRIDALEPFITDPIEPRILFAPGLTALLAELDSWPERQTNHHYDGLSALELLWTISVTRQGGANAIALPTKAQREARTVGAGRGRDDDDGLIYVPDNSW